MKRIAFRITPLVFGLAAAISSVAQKPTVENAPLTWNTGPYGYDAAGNITSIGGQYFFYDATSRLTTAHVTTLNAAATQTYTYDPYGNMTAMAGYGDPQTLTSAPSTNHLAASIAEYDEAGNVKRWHAPGATYDYAYDAVGMMTALQTGTTPYTVTYVYTADDERLRTADLSANDSHYTLRDLDGALLTDFELKGSAWSLTHDYVYRDDAVTASISPSNAVYFSLDHVGTPRLLTDDSGYVAAFQTFLPFGQELGQRLIADGAVKKFTGHERDADPAVAGNPLDYMHARFYTGLTGRFLSTDPAPGNPLAPQSWNAYAYVENQPLLFVDPDGMMMKPLFDEATGTAQDGSITIRAKAPRAEYERDLRQAAALQRALARERGRAGVARGASSGDGPRGSRLPDYFDATVNAGWLVGFTVQIIVDRYGRVWIAPGGNIGKSATFLSGSANVGWLKQSRKPSAEKLEKYISGLSITAGGGFGVGGNLVWGMPGLGREAGLFTPQVGVSATYGIQTALAWYKW
jgi:RHS repeat-associated protein